MANIVGRNARSTTGKNLKCIERDTGLDPWRVKAWRVKKAVKRVEVPDREGWRVQYLGKLIVARSEMETMCQDVKELDTLIESLCSS